MIAPTPNANVTQAEKNPWNQPPQLFFDGGCRGADTVLKQLPSTWFAHKDAHSASILQHTAKQGFAHALRARWTMVRQLLYGGPK
jgi:hypothetical protein